MLSFIYDDSKVRGDVMQELEKAESFYQKPLLNWSGVTTSGERYTEVIARLLTEEDGARLKKIMQVEEPKRKKDYRVKHQIKPEHSGEALRDLTEAPKDEVMLAKWMWAVNTLGEELGECADFQMPLFEKAGDGKVNVDLVSVNEKEKTVFLIELKDTDSKESLLRCALEVATYWSIVTHNLDDDGEKKLLREYRTQKEQMRAWPVDHVVPVVLIAADNREKGPYADLKDLENRPELKGLLEWLHKRCGLRVFSYRVEGSAMGVEPAWP